MIKGADALLNLQHGTKAELIAQAFTEFLDEFHSYKEPYDDKLDAELHERYAAVKRKYQRFDFRSLPYFSPSSADACPRELYHKVRKDPRDPAENVAPYQRRWTALGTAVGDWLQRELLLAERHFEKFTGKPVPFRVARTTNGDPYFEDFVKTMKRVEHRGKAFNLFGTTDGVLEYVTEDGEVLRVGIEIKSKQTTAAKTSLYSMREPEPKHISQCVSYSAMYGVDLWLIVYVNTSRKSWVYPEGEYEKNPDFRVFGVEIDDQMRAELFDRFVDVLDAVESEVPPEPDLERWTFNGFKQIIAETLTDAELDDIRRRVARVKKSRLPDFKKRGYIEALEFIEEAKAKESL